MTAGVAHVLGIIPARCGSKGVLRKNVRPVGGLPLIAYAIRAGRGARRIDRLVVSTDDADIAAVACDEGAEVVLRPAALAADDTPMLPVVQHAFETAECGTALVYTHGVLLQPTCPLRSAADIDGALELLLSTGADSVLSVEQVSDYHPARMYTLAEGRLVPYAPEPPGRLRQDLPAVFHRNGAIYAFRKNVLERGTLIGPDTRPFIMPRERSLNIDEEWDLLLADLYLTSRRVLRS